MNYENCGKRLFDLVFSIVGFLLISPFLLIVGAGGQGAGGQVLIFGELGVRS